MRFDSPLDGGPVVIIGGDTGFASVLDGAPMADQGQPSVTIIAHAIGTSYGGASISADLDLGFSLRLFATAFGSARMAGTLRASPVAVKAAEKLTAILRGGAAFSETRAFGDSRMSVRLSLLVSMRDVHMFGVSSIGTAGESGSSDEALAVSWLDDLPYPLVEHGHDFDPRNARTQMDSGRVRHRRVCPDLMETMKVNWNFTEDQYSRFEGFFLETLANGSLPFLLIDEDRELEVAFLQATYSFSRSDNLFSVQADLEVIDSEPFVPPTALIHSSLNASGAALTFEAGDVTVETTILRPPLVGLFGWYKADGQLDFWEFGPLPFLRPTQLDPPLYDYSGYVSTFPATHNMGRSGNPAVNTPVFADDVINGYPALRYDEGPTGNEANALFPDFSGGLVVDLPVITPCTGTTMAIVMRRSSVDPYFQDYTMLGVSQESGSPTYFNWGNIFSKSVDGINHSIRAGIGYPTPNATPWVDVPLGSWQVITMRYSKATGLTELRTNDSTVNSSVPVFVPTGVLIDYWIMQNSSYSDVAEFLFYDGPISDADLLALRTYLSLKYDVAITV